MAMPEIDEVKDAALKYDKKALAKMVQMGQMSNTTAMMAAMMRDRIVQSEMKPPAPPTVADEVFQPAMQQGLAAVPTDPRMFQGMAGGGIVAMAGGGDVQRFQNRGSVLALPREIQAVLDRKIAQLNLDPDYVYRAISMASPEKQSELFAQLGVALPSMEVVPVRADGPVAPTFTGAVAQTREPTGLENIAAKQERARPVMAAAYNKAFQDLTRGFPEDYSPEALGQPTDTPTSGNPLFDTLGRFGKKISDAVMYSSDREAAMDRELAKYDPDRGMIGSRVPGATRPMGQAEVDAARRLTGVRQEVAQPAPEKGGLGATPEAAAAAAPRKSYLQRAGDLLEQELGKDEPVTSEQDIIDRQRRFDKASGVNREFFKEQADALAAQREELKLDRKEAANMRLLEAGLSILGGTSPYAFENIGKGASKALAGFADDVKDIKKQQREFDRSLIELRKSEEIANRSDSARALASFEKNLKETKDRQDAIAKSKLDLAVKLEGLDIERARVEKPSDTMQLFKIATEGMTPEQKQATAGAALGRGAARTDFTKGELLTSWSSIEKDPAALDRYNQMGITGFSQYEQYMRTGMKPIDIDALRYARENPNDPRSAQILQRLGVK